MDKVYTLGCSDYINMGKDILSHTGVSEEHAEILMSHLLDSDEKGIYTHGFYRLPTYLKQIKRGNINPRPNIQKLKSGPIVQLLDGDDGLGAIVSYYAMQEAIQTSSERGIGVVGVRRSSHFGAAAYYAEMPARSNQIGIVFSNASPGIAPTGSLTPVLGNNPWSISVPTNLNYPITLDIANSVAARGKIRLAALKGESIPFGWAINKYGEPTADPQEALEGAILPIGDYKGYGITLMIDILSGVLTGANFGDQVPGVEEDGVRNNGHLFISLNIEAFMNITEFKQRVDELVRMVKAAPKISEETEILLPGEREWARKLGQNQATVTIPEQMFDVVAALCREYAIDLPEVQMING
ncbi:MULTISPECIES: Ldh family oxidoreductase [unclassified Paenibacillus]|uniref:Ldh family oxidoreductase n=1 Tax=unclassified Paenibacillus TaxID=185978 RepID=UPI001AE8942B|nr:MULTISPECIES: Ldh family oxidoreductase [unclassified Paenibacillus]MBP1155841.1 LDH2 family malate/lactate/ureidoglycolate dehydrogenase [Paenibacillus sp. PvP091]MBP1168773.1 LDH2 family malate/lactate/ureidoglycolate dehydrogenase [Paenibacillus sp. PvR098]MBP2439801.1 LDH2 family malate/lactate/ureidoglycolate dehydrogenase [Paenibacillus sp. PvP052]